MITPRTLKTLFGAALCVALSFTALAAQDVTPSPKAEAIPAPGIYQSGKEEPLYLTLDAQRVVLQNAAGQALFGCRVVREDGRLNLYRFGKPLGMRVAARAGGIALEGEDGETMFGDASGVMVPCATPPEAIGWQPYGLPETDADPARRNQVAKELQRRFDLEQKLRHEAIKLSGGQMDAATMEKPEVAAKWAEINRVDEDNKVWLKQTLLSSGWIGSKSHGAQAHQAMLLVMLHNINHLRLAATALAEMQAETKRREIGEGSVANLADRFALIMGDPMSYGIQAAGGADGKPIIPILADAAQVDANRKRIGQPPLATAAAMMQATVVRLGDDGRLVEGGAAEVTGLDAIDMRKAMADPAWGLAEAGKADALLGAAITAARGGDAAPMTAWCKQAAQAHRDLLARLLEGLGRGAPGGDTEAAVVAQRALFDGYLDGALARDDGRIIVGNLLAYALVARPAAPDAKELARAVVLAKSLEAALKRPDVTRGPLGHAIADTIACIRYREGKLPEAVTLWKKSIKLAGEKVPELYRRRLAVAEAGDAEAVLPR
jgi:hypothetical protein